MSTYLLEVDPLLDNNNESHELQVRNGGTKDVNANSTSIGAIQLKSNLLGSNKRGNKQ